jgi:membrane complex biogenesis BtpA family protein
MTTALERFYKVFNQAKPIIGMVHLQPLPGSPGYQGNLDFIVSHACQEAQILADGGFDGLIVENFGDLPFYPDSVPAETVAVMTRIATEIRRRTGLPMGINVLRNDGRAALAIAASVGAQFIRANVHVGLAASEQGLLFGKAHEILRYRTWLRSECLIFADIAVKHAYPLIEQSVEEMLRDAVLRGLADAVIVTGAETGTAVEMEFAQQAKRRAGELSVPLIIGSGIDPENIWQALEISDAVIVGTSIKRDKVTTNPIDSESAKSLLQAARMTI